MDPVDNPQLKLARNFVEQTGLHIFLTGKAGTGKTTFLKNLKLSSPKRMVIVAPTGVAAINAGGVTIHSFFQMPFGPYIPTQDSPDVQRMDLPRQGYQKISREKINLMKSIDLLVIDEISMVRADLLDGMDETLRRYRHRNVPFGGVQVLMIGDLQQLAPVAREEEWNILSRYYRSPFFFDSRVLKATSYVTVELKQIFRQNNPEFIRLLNNIRENIQGPETIHELNKRFIPDFSLKDAEGYITLTTHNFQAQEINESKLRKLQGEVYSFKATIEGEFPEYSYPTEVDLTLKKGAQVMFVKNDISREKLFYNGKIGIIDSIEDDIIYVQCQGEPGLIAAGRMDWENNKYSINEVTKEIEEQNIGKFTQYPLKLAWAITIHKSQGLTFEKVILDARSAFAHGQVYVALSRCRTLEGLVLSTSLTLSGIKTDPVVTTFSKNAELQPPDEIRLAAEKIKFQQTLIRELIDFTPLDRRLRYCLKILEEHQASIHSSLRDLFTAMFQNLNGEILVVANKFNIQVNQLLQSMDEVENNEILQDRIKKACTYFEEKLGENLIIPLEGADTEIDNKVVRKALNDSINRFREELNIKTSCLSSCKAGFNTKEYLEARARANIEISPAKSAGKRTSVQSGENQTHPVLFKAIKLWRDQKAKAMNLPVYMILPQKTLTDIAALAPGNLKELGKIKGLGKIKLNQYGTEILQILNGAATQVPSEKTVVNPLPAEKPREVQAEKTPTALITYDLFRKGKIPEEIALERELTLSTIEKHLSSFIPSGKIDISELVTEQKVKLILHQMEILKGHPLSRIKEVLGDQVSWAELNFVKKYQESLKSTK